MVSTWPIAELVAWDGRTYSFPLDLGFRKILFDAVDVDRQLQPSHYRIKSPNFTWRFPIWGQ